MNIVVARPPNFEQILAAFPRAADPGVIFAWGDRLFNPSGNPIPAPLLAHESVHLIRNPDGQKWWDTYITDAEFRYREELLAHAAEYRAQLSGLDRNYKAKLLMSTAARLVAPLYAYDPPRSLTAAARDLRWEIDR